MKLAAKFRVEVAQQKGGHETKKRQARSNAIIKCLKELAEAQRNKKKTGPSALDPVMTVSTPMEETSKGKVKKRKS